MLKKSLQISLNQPILFHKIYSEKLQQAIQSNQDMEAVEIFNSLVEFDCLLQASQCTNLKTYVSDTVTFWFELLKEKLKKYYYQVPLGVNLQCN